MDEEDSLSWIDESEMPVSSWDRSSQEDSAEPEVLISAIEHYSYCPRQCALIHVEQIYEENVFTVRGTLVHERVHSEENTPLRGVPVVRGMPLWSSALRLRGKADLVELGPEGPYPVEYKSGRRRGQHADLQLCAQALCLEEMFDVPVSLGAVYYFATRSRQEVSFDEPLRQRTRQVIEQIRSLLADNALPPPRNDARCRNCSLKEACLPDVLQNRARLRGFQGALFRVWDRDQPGAEPDIEEG
jgi:CRISPR-associated exonuclease Cas4